MSCFGRRGEEMPTQRFFHLKEEKQNIIKQAAMEECARVPYNDISINKIIKAADISRGSFYTYFEDKDDMIKYLLDDFRMQCVNYICSEIQKEDGDTITAVENMMRGLMTDAQQYEEAAVYKNLLLNVGTITSMKTLGPGKCGYDSREYQEFVERCYQVNNPEKCPFKNEEQMGVVLEMIIILAMKHLAEYHVLQLTDEKTILAVFHEQLEIIRRGL